MGVGRRGSAIVHALGSRRAFQKRPIVRFHVIRRQVGFHYFQVWRFEVCLVQPDEKQSLKNWKSHRQQEASSVINYLNLYHIVIEKRRGEGKKGWVVCVLERAGGRGDEEGARRKRFFVSQTLKQRLYIVWIRVRDTKEYFKKTRRTATYSYSVTPVLRDSVNYDVITMLVYVVYCITSIKTQITWNFYFYMCLLGFWALGRTYKSQNLQKWPVLTYPGPRVPVWLLLALLSATNVLNWKRNNTTYESISS